MADKAGETRETGEIGETGKVAEEGNHELPNDFTIGIPGSAP